MFVELTSGTQIRVSVHFHDVPVGPVGSRRATTAYIGNKESPAVKATVVCHPNDNFCRKTGRKLAAIKLLRQLKEVGYDKADRAFVFNAICPEYNASENFLRKEIIGVLQGKNIRH